MTAVHHRIPLLGIVQMRLKKERGGSILWSTQFAHLTLLLTVRSCAVACVCIRLAPFCLSFSFFFQKEILAPAPHVLLHWEEKLWGKERVCESIRPCTMRHTVCRLDLTDGQIDKDRHRHTPNSLLISFHLLLGVVPSLSVLFWLFKSNFYLRLLFFRSTTQLANYPAADKLRKLVYRLFSRYI